jgi:uncharacterized protein (UPF0332 family)
MPITTADLMHVARSLAQAGGEPNLRSCVSRAYYAAYHHAKHWHAMLPTPGSNVGPPGGLHQQLINQLAHPHVSVPLAMQIMSRQLALKLEALRGRRTFADYKLAGTQTPAEVQTHLVQSQGILTTY